MNKIENKFDLFHMYVNILCRCKEIETPLSGRTPIECTTSKEKMDDFKILCCSIDFCNLDVTLELPLKGTYMCI